VLNNAVSHNYVLIAKVTMCHESTVLRLHDIFGVGTVHKQRRQKKHFSRSWVWFCNRADAEFVILQMKPWLFTKASEADLAVEFFSLPLMEKGGRWGSRPVTPQLETKRHQLFVKLRNCKSRNAAIERRAKNENKISRHKTGRSITGID
jgi:hypothetical protein